MTPHRLDPARPTVTMIAAAAGTVVEVGDRIVPGAFTRSLRVHTPNEGLPGHQWNVPIGRVLSVKQLPPGDPRLPRTTGSGRRGPSRPGR